MPRRQLAGGSAPSAGLSILVLAAFLFGIPLGCRPQKTVSPSHSAPETPKLLRNSLSSLIPAPGVVFLLELQPALMMKDRALRKQWDLVFRSERLAAYEKASGLDLSTIQKLWIVGYPLGTLLLFDAQSCAAQVEQAFIARASSWSRDASSLPGAHLLTGIVANEPQSLYYKANDFIALAYGDVTLAKIVQGYAEGRLHAKTALETRLVAPLAPLHPDALLRAFLVGPFEQATDAVAQGFASGLAAVHLSKNYLELQVVARGAWPDNAGPAIDSWLRQLLNTREARALGFGFPTDLVPVHCAWENQDGKDAAPIELNRCETDLRYESAALAASIYRTTQASSEELLEETPLGWRSHILGSEPISAEP